MNQTKIANTPTTFMITFLFWNLYKKQLHQSIARIAFQNQADVLILAESVIDPSFVLFTLNQGNIADYHYAPSIGCQKIHIFTRFPNEFLRVVLEDERMTIRQMQTPSMHQDILLVALHFPSKRNWDEADQSAESAIFSDQIKDAERLIGHQRTIVIGDFNMDPFERGIINANGFHSVMSRQIAQKRERTVQHKSYPYFYNPMWGLLGDATPGPPGTHYFQNPGHGAYFWHTFDQILIRPDLLYSFDNSTLRILITDGEISLVDQNGLPNKEIASDHLPILAQLNI